MLVTWTVLRVRAGATTAPWSPAGAAWWQAGRSSPGRAEPPDAAGEWWSVVAGWDDPAAAVIDPVTAPDVDVWHVVLEPASSHGDLVLGDARPVDGLPDGGDVDGVVALVTLAGDSPDDGREREFFRRFLHVSRDVDGAAGHLLSLVHAPADASVSGPVLVLSVWRDVAAGLEWAYRSSAPHSSAVARQRVYGLVRTSGSLRCAVRSSMGTIGDLGDPLAGLRGRVALAPAALVGPRPTGGPAPPRTSPACG